MPNAHGVGDLDYFVQGGHRTRSLRANTPKRLRMRPPMYQFYIFLGIQQSLTRNYAGCTRMGSVVLGRVFKQLIPKQDNNNRSAGITTAIERKTT